MNRPANPSLRPPRVGSAQLQLLERLCNACGVSGDEAEVRAIVLEHIRPSLRGAGEVKVDALGNVLVRQPGEGENRLRVMLTAHMDEVGFMLTNDEGDGYFRFDTVGGLDVRQLPGKPVWVGRERISGVIGAKPIHLTTPDERKRSISLETLRIDMGSNGGKVKIGDRATFATTFSRLGPSLRAKALDNRLGVLALIELVKHAPTHIDLLAAFTVQEEVGVRGAKVAAYVLDPQLAIVLDCTPANDLPSWEYRDERSTENARYNTRLGAGPAIYLVDSRTVSDPRLIQHLVESAESARIPYQFRQPGGGGTDAGAVHLQRAGVPSLSVSVPGRYAHTAAGIARLADLKNFLALIHTALARLTPDVLTRER